MPTPEATAPPGRRPSTLDLRSAGRGLDTSVVLTLPWLKPGSVSERFRMGEFCGCVRRPPGQRSRPSGASSTSPARGPARSLRACAAGDYVVVSDSPTSAREKSVVLTSRGADYLRTQRTAARAIEAELVAELGEAAFAGLLVLLDALDALDSGENPRLRTYLQGSQPHAEPTAPIATRATQENPRSP